MMRHSEGFLKSLKIMSALECGRKKTEHSEWSFQYNERKEYLGYGVKREIR